VTSTTAAEVGSAALRFARSNVKRMNEMVYTPMAE
jgi:hypothetical protein